MRKQHQHFSHDQQPRFFMPLTNHVALSLSKHHDCVASQSQESLVPASSQEYYFLKDLEIDNSVCFDLNRELIHRFMLQVDAKFTFGLKIRIFYDPSHLQGLCSCLLLLIRLLHLALYRIQNLLPHLCCCKEFFQNLDDYYHQVLISYSCHRA